MSLTGPTPPDDLVRVLEVSKNGLYFQVAATVVILWDHATTFDLEVELIWKKKWSLVQIFYLLNRYVGNGVFIHGTAYQIWTKGKLFEIGCRSGVYVQAWMAIVTVYSMQGIIINRVWCMYHRSRKILIVMIIALAGELISSLVIMGLETHITTTVFSITPTLTFCVPSGFSHFYWLFWCFIIAFDLLVFGLALAQGITYFREKRAAHQKRHGQSSMISTLSVSWETNGNIFQVLLRDSITFPFIGLMICLFNILAWFSVLPFGALQIVLVMSSMGSSLLGCRLVLNLRDAYYKPFAEEFRQPTLNKFGARRGSVDRTEMPSFELPVIFTRSHDELCEENGHIS
ncbi:hypothetical protein FA15DRAFT_674837 [Coprinopsis marcescibilis]|uniref:DUF6533 domain-containing protein n=1 Tax=Coprinopsis marcescibilis TaxID=230819 RepID=A0A5C3KG79_COPMA|nr:hypothetical protein FA15DRAFT_674837 [Coprinopsis marcescibilis]